MALTLNEITESILENKYITMIYAKDKFIARKENKIMVCDQITFKETFYKIEDEEQIIKLIKKIWDDRYE